MLYTNLIQKHWLLNKVSKKNKNRRAETATTLSAPVPPQKRQFSTAFRESNSDFSNRPIAHQHLRAMSQRQSDKTNREITAHHPYHFIGERQKINS